jgi:RNA polymerase sigma-54 factor
MSPKLGLHLGLYQKQQLVMTQRLQQALKLLQVPTLELEQILRQELQINPLLEEVDPAEETEEELEQEQQNEAEQEARKEPTSETQDTAGESVDWDEYFEDGFRGSVFEREHEPDDEDRFERPTVYIPSGQDDLTAQLHLAVADPLDRKLGEYLIGCMNADGFLACELAEVAAFFEVDEQRVIDVLTVIQSFDPPGIGARDVRECLLLQLVAKDQADSLEAHVVEHHFEALKNRKFGDIAREMKTTPREVQEIASRIGELDPRPGLSDASEGARFIMPDLVVHRVDEDSDEYVVYLNDGNLPRLRVSKEYEATLQDKERRDDDAVKFIDEKKRYAEWIIKTIEQRRRTMIKVMEAIVDAQKEFFEQGAIALKPLTLQQVASVIGMHESTVSRVTRQKYVQTPRGVFPLKYFFSAGLDTVEGTEIAAKAVKIMIQEIVENEDPKKPLSDKKIVDRLEQRGLKIARRTVAKYREQMGILSARMRKQF